MQQYRDLLIDALLDQGFTLPEAEDLIVLQTQVELARHRDRIRRDTEYWLSMNYKTDKDTNK